MPAGTDDVEGRGGQDPVEARARRGGEGGWEGGKKGGRVGERVGGLEGERDGSELGDVFL